LLISIAELFKLSMGTNGAILVNSKYYKILFYFSIAMALSVIFLNKILIEFLGIEGAALATLLVVLIFNSIKILYVKRKFNMHPYTKNTQKVLALLGFLFVVFYFVNPNINPLLSIFIKSTLLASIFIYCIIKWKISEDINTLFYKYFKRH